MSNSYITRSIEPVLRRAAVEFPAVVLTGPRQSGKTTLLKHLFSKTHRYVSLEPPDVQAAATSDPRGFLAQFEPPVILDEVHFAPVLLPYIKERIDSEREKRGRFLITGSQNLLVMARVTETLAGRAAVLKLFPLSRREIDGRSDAPLPWEMKERPVATMSPARLDLWRGLLRGFYPELVTEPSRDTGLWYSSYVQTYLERDVRAVRQVGDLLLFQNFLRALAARCGQLLSLTDLSRDLGVSLNTVKAWLSVLEATYQVMVLRPYFANAGKRTVKTPKVYFTDTGLLCYLAGLKAPEHAAAGPLAGGIFESAVLSEVVKAFANRGEEPPVYFWRASYGAEVDIVVESAGKLIPVEVKLTSTPRPAMSKGIDDFRDSFGTKCGPGYVIHTGDTRLPLAKGVTAVPFAEM